jgi:hypothetical protein
MTLIWDFGNKKAPRETSQALGFTGLPSRRFQAKAGRDAGI